MASPPRAPDLARRVLALAPRDRAGAEALLAGLPLDAQVAAVCDAPLARRAEVLALTPMPEAVTPRLPEAELCFLVKAVGLSDAVWILEDATPEQVVASVDLDAWKGDEPDLPRLSEWLEALARTSRPTFLRAVRALDAEIVVRFLQSRIQVFQKPTDDEGWSAPEGSLTLEGQFHYRAIHEGDDLAAITALLRMLFEEEYWTYFRTMQGVICELPSDCDEWALRWRTGRLEDLGFPPRDEAMRIYRFIRPEQRGIIPDGAHPLDVAAWHLPVWIPQLPDSPGAGHRLFRAIAQLADDERRACFYAFVAVSNQVAVADRMPLGDAESTPRAIDKAARLISEGLAHVAGQNGLEDTDVLRRVSLERLFSVGANLDPEGSRP
jgi:hypothetical protein